MLDQLLEQQPQVIHDAGAMGNSIVVGRRTKCWIWELAIFDGISAFWGLWRGGQSKTRTSIIFKAKKCNSFISPPPQSLFPGMKTYYRHPYGADYVLPLFIYFFFFYSPFVLRNYSTDSHQIFKNCVFWSSLNNPVVLKFFGRHLAEKNTKKQRKFGQNFTGWLRFLTITSKR